MRGSDEHSTSEVKKEWAEAASTAEAAASSVCAAGPNTMEEMDTKVCARYNSTWYEQRRGSGREGRSETVKYACEKRGLGVEVDDLITNKIEKR